jgi:hypothetical protein
LTTSDDIYISPGEQVTIAYEAVVVPFERYGWLLRCEARAER